MKGLSYTQRREIDRCSDLLVEAAEELLREARVADIPENDFGHSQLRNLIAIATETESPLVVVNFIRYQMGRERGWTHGRDQRLGDRFIRQLDAEDGAVAQALARISGLESDAELRQLARIELVRNFLGFASRYLKYLDLERREKARQRRGRKGGRR